MMKLERVKRYQKLLTSMSNEEKSTESHVVLLVKFAKKSDYMEWFVACGNSKGTKRMWSRF